MSKQSIDGIFNKFLELNTSSSKTQNVELEIRFQNVDFNNFKLIYEKLSKKSKGIPEQTLNTLVMVPQSKKSNIKEIKFENGKKIDTKYKSKEQLLLPVRIVNNNGLSYSINLSLESTCPIFNCDGSSLIRLKHRICFIQDLWQIDMTIVIQINKNQIKDLQKIIDYVFKDSNNFINNIDCPFVDKSQFIFEIEAEFINTNKSQLIGINIDKTKIINDIVEFILQLANTEYINKAILGNQIYKVAQYLIQSPSYLQKFEKDLGLKQLLPSVLAITKSDYKEIYPPKHLFLTDKADGIRAIGAIFEGYGYVLTTACIQAPHNIDHKLGDTICDCEYINDCLYVFDVLVVKGISLVDKSFDKRITYIDDAIEHLRLTGLKAESKKYIHIIDNTVPYLKKVILETYENKQRPYNIDGLIFVEPDKSYLNTKSYKWKSTNDNTIDFVVKKVKNDEYNLFVGIKDTVFNRLGLNRCQDYDKYFPNPPLQYFPIQFSPSINPNAYKYFHKSDVLLVDNNIVELRYNIESKTIMDQWTFVRVRDDRKMSNNSDDTNLYFGNDFYTAELTLLNELDPFPIDLLWEGGSSQYFMNIKTDIYLAQVFTLSYIKTEWIKQLAGLDWVIDIGAGKGQDLKRYLDANIKQLIAIDKDKSALSELIRRKLDMARKSNFHHQSKNQFHKSRGQVHKSIENSSTNVMVLAADINQAVDETIKSLMEFKIDILNNIDAIICNLAIHYFISDKPAICNLALLISKLLKSGGTFSILNYNGKAIFDLLIKNKVEYDSTWDAREPDSEVLKYSIRRLFKDDVLENCGQLIGVRLPFSQGVYYQEFLVNLDYIIEIFGDYGLKCKSNKSAIDFVNEFKKHNSDIGNKLTDLDIMYIQLHNQLIFIKE